MIEMPSQEQRFTSGVNFVLIRQSQRNARRALAVEFTTGLQVIFQGE